MELAELPKRWVCTVFQHQDVRIVNYGENYRGKMLGRETQQKGRLGFCSSILVCEKETLNIPEFNSS